MTRLKCFVAKKLYTRLIETDTSNRILRSKLCCQQRITAFDQTIIILTILAILAVDRDNTAVNGLGLQQVFTCLVYE